MELKYYKREKIACCMTDIDMLITNTGELSKVVDIEGNETQAELMKSMPECTKEEFEATIDISTISGKLLKAILDLSIMESEDPGGQLTKEQGDSIYKTLAF